jgi:hypothetical protein
MVSEEGVILVNLAVTLIQKKTKRYKRVKKFDRWAETFSHKSAE